MTPTTTHADDHPPAAVEYVLDESGGHTVRSESAGSFAEKVEVREQGGRTNRWITGVEVPSITLFLPRGEPTAACVVCPGGGYGGLSFDKEGVFVARWLCERGIAAGVLKYATGAQQPLGDRPLRDAEAGIRFLRDQGFEKVGVVGFSAGGHLAAWAAASQTGGAERLAFHAVIYPVITMQDGAAHRGSRQNLLGSAPSREQIDAHSVERLVTRNTPPAFIVHTADDDAVPVENSLRYFRACNAAGVAAELHIYPRGGHGYGMWSDRPGLRDWPEAFGRWLSSLGLTR